MGTTGVVGQVISVSTYSSQVRLLNDAQSGVAVMLQSSRSEGILSGSVEGVLYLEGVDEGVEVTEGEAVITSGLGGGYFRGLVYWHGFKSGTAPRRCYSNYCNYPKCFV